MPHQSEQDWYDPDRSTPPVWSRHLWWALPALVAIGLLIAVISLAW